MEVTETVGEEREGEETDENEAGLEISLGNYRPVGISPRLGARNNLSLNNE